MVPSSPWTYYLDWNLDSPGQRSPLEKQDRACALGSVSLVRAAPSANWRRSKFGMRNAMKKASVASLAPKKRANTASRTKPDIRDSKVIADTTAVDLSSLLIGNTPGVMTGTSEISIVQWRVHILLFINGNLMLWHWMLHINPARPCILTASFKDLHNFLKLP